MPYYFDPYQYSYVYYPEGKKPPKPNPNAEEYVPGFAEEYVNSFPNQPYSEMVGGGEGIVDYYKGLITTAYGGEYYDGPSAGNGPTGNKPGEMDSAKKDAFEFLKKTFESYGLGSLAPKILEYIQQGYGADTIALMLQDTDEYKKRFAGNELRKKAGLPILSPAEYLALESTYKQILDSNGMPKGFYDSNDDFTAWIGSNVSPMEIQSRVELAARAVNNTDNHYLESLREYGLGSGDLVAAMLDRSRALPLLQKRVREAEIGAEARRQGLRLSQARADYFESMGVDQGTAASAYQMIGATLPYLSNLGDIYGDSSYGQETIEDELLGRSGLASERRRRLQNREVGSFSGESGLNKTSLGVTTRGSF